MRWHADVPDETIPSPADAAASEREPARIPFVDDNADLRQYVQRLLGTSYEGNWRRTEKSLWRRRSGSARIWCWQTS